MIKEPPPPYFWYLDGIAEKSYFDLIWFNSKKVTYPSPVSTLTLFVFIRLYTYKHSLLNNLF